MILRYSDGPDDFLAFEIIRADEEGEPIDPPLLKMTDRSTGEHYTLDTDEARKVRDFINSMWG